jgi:hypothetical protein
MRDVEIDKVYLNDCDARLLPIRGGYIAEIHTRHQRTKQNFSLCHEVAHTFFSDDNNDTRETVSCSESYSSSHEFEEWLCDNAAAELLMPKESFELVASGFAPSLDSVATIAEMFDASFSATALRIKNLDVWPCTFVYIQQLERPDAPPEFRIKDSLAPESIWYRRGGSKALISALNFRLSRRFDDKLGLEEALRTGEDTSTTFLSDGHSFSLQFRRYYQHGRAHIVGFALHDT